MIKISQIDRQQDIFDPINTRAILFKVENKTTDEVFEKEILPENAARWKAKTIRTELMSSIEKLIKQRKGNLASVLNEPEAPQDKYDAVLELEHTFLGLSTMNNQNLYPALRYIKQHIIYKLDQIAPSHKSKFYKNYHMKVTMILSYVNQQIRNFERANELTKSKLKTRKI